jgi:hypothetical protein
MPSKRTTTYSGKLSTRAPKQPKRLHTRPLTGDEDNLERLAKIDPDALPWFSEMRERFWLLLDHFGIDRNDPDRWLYLAYLLARAYVPGMRPPAGGRRRTKDTATARSARRQLRELIKNKQESAAARIGVELICKALVRKRPAELPDYYRKRAKLSASVLKADYDLAGREDRQMIEMLRAWRSTPEWQANPHPGGIAGWFPGDPGYPTGNADSIVTRLRPRARRRIAKPKPRQKTRASVF